MNSKFNLGIMKKILTAVLVLILAAYFNSCSDREKSLNEDNVHKEESSDGHSHEDENITELTEEQIKSTGIEFGSIEKKELTSVLKANGFLKVPNQNKATVTSLYGGVIKSILVQPGRGVRRGQTIATVFNNSFITMQEEFLSTSAEEDLASIEFDRQKNLLDGNAASLKNYQIAEAKLKTLNAKKSSLNKQLELMGINTDELNPENLQSIIRVPCPINGTVSNVLVNIGSYVEANNPIAEIVDNKQLHLDLFVYEKDLDKLQTGQTIHFTLTNNPGKEYDAKIFSISNTFEPESKAIAVHASVFGNRDGLIDGMSVTAIVSLKDALVSAIPSEAIVNFQGQDFIFVLDSKETKTDLENDSHNHEADEHLKEGGEHNHEIAFKRIPVKAGTTDVGYTEITLLSDDDYSDLKVVTKGAFFILAKMTNSGEHEH